MGSELSPSDLVTGGFSLLGVILGALITLIGQHIHRRKTVQGLLHVIYEELNEFWNWLDEEVGDHWEKLNKRKNIFLTSP